MKNNLVQVNNGQLGISSRDIADMISKRHDNLVRVIDHYIEIIGQNSNLRADDFFVETSYTAGTGKNYKAYFLTKKGCDMVANKMTGDKGILFTATYIDKFYEMEKKLSAPIESNNIKSERLAIMKQNAKVREAQLWEKLAQVTDNTTYKQICTAYAANTLGWKAEREEQEKKTHSKFY